MANETQITVVGNLCEDPILRFTPSGAAVANFTIASTPRQFDKDSGQWVDQEALFLRCSLWREYAENAAESLTKGQRVIAQGNLRMRSYETKEGEKRTSTELEVQEIGPALRFAKAQVTRAQGGQQGGQQQNWNGQGGFQQQAQRQPQPRRQQAQADPWSQQGGGNYQWNESQQESAPF